MELEISSGESTYVKKQSKLKRFVFRTFAILLSLLFCFLILEFGFARFYYSDLDQIKMKATPTYSR